eukprot:2119883-Amphidinium_carterae.1
MDDESNSFALIALVPGVGIETCVPRPHSCSSLAFIHRRSSTQDSQTRESIKNFRLYGKGYIGIYPMLARHIAMWVCAMVFAGLWSSGLKQHGTVPTRWRGGSADSTCILLACLVRQMTLAGLLSLTWEQWENKSMLSECVVYAPSQCQYSTKPATHSSVLGLAKSARQTMHPHAMR